MKRLFVIPTALGLLTFSAAAQDEHAPPFEKMAAQNRVGYDFYSTQPGSIVNNGQKKWRKMLALQSTKKKSSD